MASRSVTVILQNTTEVQLTYVTSSLAHGEWDVPVPGLVPSKSAVAWTSESDGLWTGTQGLAEFYATHPSDIVTLNWDNPYVGSNSYSGTAPAPYTIVYSGGVGDMAVVVFTFGT
jgi:Aegerolysin